MLLLGEKATLTLDHDEILRELLNDRLILHRAGEMIADEAEIEIQSIAGVARIGDPKMAMKIKSISLLDSTRKLT